YTLHLNMQGYGATDQSVTISTGANTDVVMSLTARASIYGKVTLNAPAAVGTWVPVQGTPAGSPYPTVYGGTFINSGQQSAIYTVFPANAGPYTFSVQPQGFIPSTASVIVGTSDIGNPSTGGLDFSGFSLGNKITGTITINGDTTAQPNPMTIWINAS